MALVDGFRQQLHAALRPEHLEKRVDWNHDEIVLRLPEDTAQLFCDANDFERNAVNLDRLPDRVSVREELVLYIRADEGDRGVAGNLILRYSRSRINLYVVERGDVGRNALNVHAFQILTLKPHAQ